MSMSRATSVALVAALLLLVLLAVPAWRRHAIQERVERALGAAEAVKLVVMEAATMHGGLAGLKASQLSYNRQATDNPYVDRLEIADGGRITVVTRDTGASPDPVLELVPREMGQDATGTLVWSCRMTAGDAAGAPRDCPPGSTGP